MDHRYNYFHHNPNALVNGQPTYNRSSTDVTRPTNNYSGSISSTSSRDQSPFNERHHINPNVAPLTNNHLYQMDSYNQLPRSSGPPRTNAKGIYDSSQSSIPNVLNLAQSSAENYPINPDFQLQPHLTGLLPQKSKNVPEVYPEINYRTNKESIAANMSANYFSSNISYPEPKIIEYDMEETSTESSPQHTSSLYSESTDQDSESTHPNSAFPRHTLNKNTECHVTKESKPVIPRSQEFPVPSQFADLNLNTSDTIEEHQHSILHNAYQNDNTEDIPLSENINQNDVELILENQENPESQLNEQSFSMSRTQPYHYFSNKKDQNLTELNYENKQRSSPLVSNSTTNYSFYSVNNPSSIQNPYFGQSSISTQSNSLKSSNLQSSSQPFFPFINTEQLKKEESSNIQNYEDKMQFENHNQDIKYVHPVIKDTNVSQIDSKLQSNINNSNKQENIILNQPTSQNQSLNIQSGDISIHSNVVDSCHQQNIHNVESVSHQLMYSSFKPSASELNSSQSINTYNSLKSTQADDSMTSAAVTDPSRNSSSISEAIVKQNQNASYHLYNDQTRYIHKLFSPTENPTKNLVTQDSTKIVKSEFDNTVSQSPSKSLFQNQEIMVDQSKSVDKLSCDSKDQQCDVKSLPSSPFTNISQPNNFTCLPDTNYQQLHQSSFQQSTIDNLKTSINDEFSSNSINLVTQSMKNQNLITQPSISTNNHSISTYFDTVNASNQTILKQQQSSIEQPYSQLQNAHTQDIKPITSSFSSSDKLNNFMTSNVQNTDNVISLNEQPPSTKLKFEETESFNLDRNMLSKEMVTSNSQYHKEPNNLIKESFQNSENKTYNSQMPDNVTPNDQFSNLTISNKQNNMLVSKILNQEQTTSASQISKEICDKEENPSKFQNISHRINESNNATPEYSNINSTSHFTIFPPPDLNQLGANQFSSQQFNDKVNPDDILPNPSTTNQWPPNIMNSNLPISNTMSPTTSQQPTQSFSNQSTNNLSSQIFSNQPKLDTAPLQSTPSIDVTPTSTTSISPAVNQFPPQIFSNQPKSNAEPSLQQTSLDPIQQLSMQTPNAVPPVSSECNQLPPQILCNQPKSPTTLPVQAISSPYSTQLFNNQQMPAMVTPVSTDFNQFSPSTLNNQPKSDYLPTTENQYPFKTINHQSTASGLPVPSNIKQFPSQILYGPIKSELMPPLQTATSNHALHSLNNQPTQNIVPSKTNQLPPSIFGNSNNLPPFQPAASQQLPQTLSNQPIINATSLESYKANQLLPQVFSNQVKADVPPVQTPSNWYSPQSFNNQHMSNIVPPVSSVANQLPPHMFNVQSKSDVVPPLQPKSNQYAPQLPNSQPKSSMVMPISTTTNQVPLQMYSNQPKFDTHLPNKTASSQYLSQPLGNQSIPSTPLIQQVTNQYSSQPFNNQSKLHMFPSPQTTTNKYPLQSLSNQQGVFNQSSSSNQLVNQTNSAQHSQRILLPNTNQPIQLSTIPLSNANFPNQISPILPQQKSINLPSNMTTVPPHVNLPTERSGLQSLPPNSLSSNIHFNQVQGNVQQSQAPMLPGQNVQFPLQSNKGISNQINYQQPNTNYGQQEYQYQSQGPYMPEQNASIVQQGFAKTWGHDTLDLLKSRDVLPSDGVQPPEIKLPQGYSNSDNCSPDIFRCTMNKFPSSKNLLDKSRLPLGILIHPYKDLSRLTVIQCETITRCRNCRSYINPFVQFIDNAHWKCNLCYRVNELPGEFQIDPYTKRLGDPSRRPEILNATIEYIASQDYMVRPPQPALYLFLLDVSRTATLTGYLEIVCDRILNKIMGSEIPGDSRTNIGFITYDSSVHFYQIANNDGGQPKQLIVSDISDIFLPLPDGLMVNLEENKSAIKDLLTSLPNLYRESYNTGCALGAALQAAFKILAPRGGRITVFQACLPNVGPGSLQPRDDGAPHIGDRVQHMTPSTDFYKKLALECSAEQIAVDMFFVSSQYLDIATVSGISKYSAGCIYNFPQFDVKSPTKVTRLINCFDRYLSRKIGFEALLRLRCTRGVAIHSFHGNFFVRSSDLLMLPNVNPDNAYGMQLSIEDSLDGVSVVCFQAALLYTSSNAERRIRVHTLCIPVTDNLNDVFHNADQQAITCLIAKMAVDRSTEKSLSDAREAFFNAISDSLSAFKLGCSSYNGPGTMLSPLSLKVFPLYILATLKHEAFRTNQPTRLDERMFSMCQMKSLPLNNLVQYIYPDLYPIHNLEEQPKIDYEKLTEIPLPPVIQLSAERVESNGIYLMDDSETLTVFVGHRCSDQLIQKLFGYVNVSSMPELITSFAEVDSKLSNLLHSFISYLQHFKSYPLPIEIIKDNGPHKLRFYSRLIEDKFESSLSYYEFLQRLSQQVR